MERNNDIIKRVFQSMEYGKNTQSAEKALEWFKSKNYKFSCFCLEKEIELFNKISTEKSVLCTVQKNKTLLHNTTTNWSTFTPFKIFSTLTKFSDEIYKNIETICQIEMLTRGLLKKDTKKQANLMGDYIKYYSSYAMRCNNEKNDDCDYYIEINETTGLSVIGAALGIGMANGWDIVFFCPPLLVPIITYIFELGQNAGVSVGDFKILSLNKTHVPYIKCVYFKVERFKIPMIIFDSADLDAACDSVTEAAWGHMGTLPESVGTLIVQESVFESFVKKLKDVVKSARIGNAADGLADLAYADKPTAERLMREASEARKRGIEVFQADASSKTFQPTLFIGAAARSNRVVDDDAHLSCGVAVVSFRHIDEAVRLAENSKQGYAASVWTENVGLANEIAAKLNVANVWLNGHGLFSAEVPISPRKDSGWGVIGGEGYRRPSANHNMVINQLKPKATKPMLIDIFFKTVNNIMENKNSHIPEDKKEHLVTLIFDCITRKSQQNSSKLISGHMVNSLEEPIGQIDFNFEDFCNEKIKAIVQSILDGNSIMVYANDKGALILNEIFKYFQNDVINIKPLDNSTKGKLYCEDLYLYRETTCSKNIWTNVGASSQYKM
ncbi:unnamed protein product [Brassicogethes aeneus]|uniref:Aldehyde dehydrogenase domain-containing protein n=1 Tax=Brassicogethes aeneus TaxID=1431903 RepID=A0A9P0FH67_BRAAE|nr:unnamed protein product [Brassicogethes aeneus]